MYTLQTATGVQNPTKEILPENEGRWQQFAMMVAHDLKEPIRNMGQCAELLLHEDNLDPDQRKQLNQWLKEGSVRLQGMLDALLNQAKMGEERMEPKVALSVILHNILEDIHYTLQERQAVVVVKDELPEVSCGPLGMRIVLQNLIENALKFSKPGVPPRLEVTAASMGSGWLFEVRDEGIGMEPRLTSRAFEPYRRFEKKVEGTGMGLWHVRHIIEEHGGRIWIESQPGMGTTVSFTLPDAVRTEIETPELKSTGCPKG